MVADSHCSVNARQKLRFFATISPGSEGKMNRTVVTAVAVVCLTIGIALISLHWQAMSLAAVGQDWTQTIGTIESVGSAVTYRYDVGGRRYRSSRIAIGSDLGGEMAKAYRAGQTLLVYVNPANPAESILQFAPRPGWIRPMGGGLAIFAGVGFGVLVFLARSRQKKVPARTTSPGLPMSRLRPPPSVKRQPPPGDDTEV